MTNQWFYYNILLRIQKAKNTEDDNGTGNKCR